MIPRSKPNVQSTNQRASALNLLCVDWQYELQNLITDYRELLHQLELELPDKPEIADAIRSFPLRVTHSFVSRMQKGNPNDPLLLQALPVWQEAQSVGEIWSQDPLQEKHYAKAPGLIHKYQGRVLLIAARQCAINCRYCFRRHFDYAGHSPSRTEWQHTLTHIENDPSIFEVILSGGDPLVLADKQLHWLLQQIENIKHVKYLRIHSRLPIVLPQRLTEDLLGRFAQSRLKIVMVVHANHPNELDSRVQKSLSSLRNYNITALNQSVLLKNINNDCEIFTKLSIKLFECSVLPYYLHLLDKVNGATHFEVPREEAIKIYKDLRAKLPGYLVPQLVEEIPGADSKTVIT